MLYFVDWNMYLYRKEFVHAHRRNENFMGPASTGFFPNSCPLWRLRIRLWPVWDYGFQRLLVLLRTKHFPLTLPHKTDIS